MLFDNDQESPNINLRFKISQKSQPVTHPCYASMAFKNVIQLSQSVFLCL